MAGLEVAREPAAVRHRIGVALQEAGLDPRQTGRELLIPQGRLFGLSTHEAGERAEDLLALVGSRTRPMEIAATLNPVTYAMEALR